MQKNFQKGVLFLSALILLVLVLYAVARIGRADTVNSPQAELKTDVTDKPVQTAQEKNIAPVKTQLEQNDSAGDITLTNRLSQKIKSKYDESKQIPESLKKKALAEKVLKVFSKKTALQDVNESDLLAAQNSAADLANSLKKRKKSAWLLVTKGNAESLDALKDLLTDPNTPTALKATILEGLGYSDEPQAKELLLASLEDNDDSVVRAGIRGLGALGDPDSISILSDILHSPQAPESIIQEAAMALGGIDKQEAYDVLVNTYDQSVGQANLREDIIAALGQRNISETADFLQQIIDENPVGDQLRVAAVEAAEDATGDKSGFLLKNLLDADSEVREAAAWGLAADDQPAQVADALSNMLATEQDSEVRKRLYQAIANQEIPENESLTGLVLSEPDFDAKLAGYDLLAQQLHNSDSIEFAQQFDQLVVPQLKETALTAKQLNQRLSAVISLKRAQTFESARAIEQIAVESSDKNVLKAVGM